MTTQTTKPERVEVGQRWRAPDGSGVLVVDEAPWSCGDDLVHVKWENTGGTGALHPQCDLMARYTYLGPTEPGGGGSAPPAPAVGQRWRMGSFVYILDEEQASGNWHARYQDGGGTAIHASAFTNGHLTFVDHGEPASPPSQPRTGPKPVKPKCKHVVSGYCAVCFPPCTAETRHRGLTFRCQMLGKHRDHISGAAVEDGNATHRWPTVTAFTILQSRERARQEKREADARAVAAFCDEWDLLPPADGRRWP